MTEHTTITLPRYMIERAIKGLLDVDKHFYGESEVVARMLAREMAKPDTGNPVSVPEGWQLVGWWHQVEDPDECDFFFADAINGDCPHCFPCYADIGGRK